MLLVCISITVLVCSRFALQQQEQVISAIDAMTVVGWSPEWDKPQFTPQLRNLLSRCPRVDRDMLARLIVEARLQERHLFQDELRQDYAHVFDVSASRALTLLRSYVLLT